jgi:hypothetical protein
MKRITCFLPAGVIALAAIVWLVRGHDETLALEAALAARRAELAVAQPLADSTAADAAEAEARALSETVAKRKEELEAAAKAAKALEAETAALTAKLPPDLAGAYTDSFGKITDMGREIGDMFKVISSLNTLGKDAFKEGDPAAEDFAKTYMKVFSWAAEISAFEEEPAEIATFQASSLRSALGLDNAQTKQVETLVKNHFATMKTAGLTYAGRETPGWRERREASLTQLLWQLRPFVPANMAQPSILSQIVNAGGGAALPIATPPPAAGDKGEIKLLSPLPEWPRVPWVPAAPSTGKR